jgi:hypothetical protein
MCNRGRCVVFIQGLHEFSHYYRRSLPNSLRSKSLYQHASNSQRLFCYWCLLFLVKSFQRTQHPTDRVSTNWQHPLQIAHETAICRNPPIHSFTGDRKPRRSLIYLHLNMLRFYGNIRRSDFFVDTTFWQKVCL